MLEYLKKLIDSPSPEYRCDIRWWLAEGLHTDETLKREITALSEDGFGAVEFLAIDEMGADSSRYGWGSEEWIHDTHTIIEETTRNGLGASMTSGTNWSNANLPDFVHLPDDPSASKELDFTVENLVAGTKRTGQLKKSEIIRKNVSKQELVAVVAAKKVDEKNGKAVLSTATIVLTDKVWQETLDWTAPEDGEYLLFAFWLHGTGQTASPCVSVAYTINYIDRYGIDKLTDYWDREVFTPKLKEYMKINSRMQMFMDSLELSIYGKGGQLWGYHFCKEFQSRRGYDLTPWLPFVLRRIGHVAAGPHNYWYEMEDTVKSTKLRNDFYQTMTDLYIDNMLKPMQEWLHSVGMTPRAQISYGLPFEISLPGKYVDGIETESLEFASQIDSYRGLAGVAHLYNKVFSSETGATMQNYMMGLDFYTQIIYTQFAAGVTKTVLHGYASICGVEGSTDWPGHEGMWPIFSDRFGERQPAYQHYRDWTRMISRYQRLLRKGKPRRDVCVLRLDYNFNNRLFTVGNEQEFYATKMMRANEGMYWKDCSMQNAGYSYDYFAPQLLEESDVVFGDNVIQPDGPGYQAVIVYQEALPLSCARILLQYAKRGFPIIFANGLTETVQIDVEVHHEQAACRTPFQDNKDAELAAVIAEIKKLPSVRVIDEPSKVVEALRSLEVNPRVGFSEPNSQIFTLMRKDGDWQYIYAYNYMYASDKSARTTLSIEGTGRPYRIDCWTGEVSQLKLFDTGNGRTRMNLTLQPGEAAMFALHMVEVEDLYAVSTNACDVISHNGKLSVVACESGNYVTRLSDGRSVGTEMICREDIQLAYWDLTVEDWNKGEKKVIREDRNLGYVTKEVYYKTKKTKIKVGETALLPWKDIPAIGADVSGVGYYQTVVTLPDDWNGEDGAVLCMDSTGGNSAAVYVNGEKCSAFDFSSRKIDISKLLQPGRNTIMVEVASTLANRLRANGYYDKAKETSIQLMQAALGEAKKKSPLISQTNLEMGTQAYGMMGDVKLKLYKVKALD